MGVGVVVMFKIEHCAAFATSESATKGSKGRIQDSQVSTVSLPASESAEQMQSWVIQVDAEARKEQESLRHAVSPWRFSCW